MLFDFTMVGLMKRFLIVLLQLLPLATAAILCMAAAALPALAAYGISPLTVAIVAGMVLGNTVFPRFAPYLAAGVALSKTRLLRLGIVLYGLKITLPTVAAAGWSALAADIGVVVSTFLLAVWLGKRLRLPPQTAALIGAGSAICGAAAVLAAQPVLKAEERDVGVAVATVVVFGTLAMFAYPALAVALTTPDAAEAVWFGWGIYTGASVHEVAQVAAAGAAIHPLTADVAVITKMIRVMLLAPFLLALPWLMRRLYPQTAQTRSGRLTIPWFALGFVAVVALNSLISLPTSGQAVLIRFDTFLLTTAMFALGLTTRWHSVREAGFRPLLLAGIVALWLLAGGALLSYAACVLLA